MKIFISPLMYRGVNCKLFSENKSIFLCNHSTGIYVRRFTWRNHHHQILRPCSCSLVPLKMSITAIRSSQRSHFAINCHTVFISFYLKQSVGTLLPFMHDLDFNQEDRTVILENSLQSSVVTGFSFQNWLFPMATQQCCSSLQWMASGGSQFWFVPLPAMFHHKLR